ncbi:TPA: adenylate kinase [bacterium]|nr:adenylate kinase [bacterium]
MIVVLLGAPGSGKGTQSKLLEASYNLKHLSTGDLLRSRSKVRDELGKYISDKIDNGYFVSDEVMLKIIEEELANKTNYNGYVFDGYPRNLAQAIKFDELIKKVGRKIDLIINLDINDAVIVERIAARRVCKCGASYHLQSNPPAIENVCDVCGSKLYQRKDDNEESVRIRIKKYYELTKPVVDYYQKQNLVTNIDALQSIDEVHQSIKRVLEVYSSDN